jgi:hypothetical protein
MRCPACQQTFTPEHAEDPVVDLTDDDLVPPPARPEPFAGLADDRSDPEDDRPPRRRSRRRWDDEDGDRYRQPHRGGLILTLGILGLVFFPALVISLILNIVALCLANSDLREMAYGNMDPGGRGSTVAGKTCAIIGIVLTSVAFPLLCLLRLALIGSHSH